MHQADGFKGLPTPRPESLRARAGLGAVWLCVVFWIVGFSLAVGRADEGHGSADA